MEPEAFAETLTEAKLGSERRRQAAAMNEILTSNSPFLKFFRNSEQARPGGLQVFQFNGVQQVTRQ